MPGRPLAGDDAAGGRVTQPLEKREVGALRELVEAPPMEVVNGKLVCWMNVAGPRLDPLTTNRAPSAMPPLGSPEGISEAAFCTSVIEGALLPPPPPVAP